MEAGEIFGVGGAGCVCTWPFQILARTISSLYYDGKMNATVPKRGLSYLSRL